VVAVVDAQPSAAAVLTRLGDVGAQVVDDQADAAGCQAGDALAGLRVGRLVVVGAEERVDKLCRLADYAEDDLATPRRGC
jgi:hypothetical protein